MRYPLKPGGYGEGEISNISSGGLLFQSIERFIVNSKIDVTVAWPYPLNGYCPLNLCIGGRVIRSNCIGTAIAIDRYEFRTAGKNR
jgi:hypothetical protein